MDARQQLIRDTFDYRDGALYRKSGRFAGRVKGTLQSLGYWSVRLGEKNERMHRIVWEWHHGAIPPDREIDHVNGDRADNRIENLRLVTHAQNCAVRRQRSGSSELPGASLVAPGREKPWQAKIMVRNRIHSLGYYATREEASRVYQLVRAEISAAVALAASRCAASA